MASSEMLGPEKVYPTPTSVAFQIKNEHDLRTSRKGKPSAQKGVNSNTDFETDLFILIF